MRFRFRLRPFHFGAIAPVLGLGLLGCAGGCSSRPAEEPFDQSKVDREIPQGWEQTKAAMQERMKKMRKSGGR